MNSHGKSTPFPKNTPRISRRKEEIHGCIGRKPHPQGWGRISKDGKRTPHLRAGLPWMLFAESVDDLMKNLTQKGIDEIVKIELEKIEKEIPLQDRIEKMNKDLQELNKVTFIELYNSYLNYKK